MYRLEDPGSKLNLVSDWFNQLDQLGGESTAYWPNYPVRIDEEVAGFDGIIQVFIILYFSFCFYAKK